MKKIVAVLLSMFVAVSVFAQTVDVAGIAVGNGNTGETILIKDFTKDFGRNWFGAEPQGNVYQSSSTTLFTLDKASVLVRGLSFIQFTVLGKDIKMGMTEADIVAMFGQPTGKRQGAFLYYMYALTPNARFGFVDGKLYEVRF